MPRRPPLPPECVGSEATFVAPPLSTRWIQPFVVVK